MGQGCGMQGTMGMTAQASKMMDACSDMMESAMHAPNGQWQKPNQVPENKG